MSDQITAIIPVSALPSHPSTEVLDVTIDSIRTRLPDSEIIIMFDYPTATLMEYKAAYERFKQSMLWKINFMENVVPLVFDEPSHQSLMFKKALELVRTPLILWGEQDTPLHGKIPFDELIPVIENGYANVIRFHFEATIPEAHNHLMLDQKPIDILGQPFIRTRQWSGRPHLASTKYYREIVSKYFDDKPRFIEHIMYGIVAETHNDFDEHRVHIYAPDGSLVRSKHLDGRRYGAEHYDPATS
jgi:hypothetical protein